MPIKPRKKIEKQPKPDIEDWKFDFLREGLLPNPEGFFMLDFCFGHEALELWQKIKDDFPSGAFPYAEKHEAECLKSWGHKLEVING